MTATLTNLALSHAIARPKSKANRNYDPRTIMNLKEYGDIRGYQEPDNASD